MLGTVVCELVPFPVFREVLHLVNAPETLYCYLYKNIKSLKMWGWHAKKYANKVGIMHESKGQHIPELDKVANDV